MDNMMEVKTTQKVEPVFIQRLINFMMIEGWLYTGGGIEKKTGTHTIRFIKGE